MRYNDLRKIRARYLERHLAYSMTYWEDFNYKILTNIMYLYRAGRGSNDSYNDVIIMADTETSKKGPGVHENHVVAWTISIRAYGRNLVTLWGRVPSDLVECMDRMTRTMAGDITYIYFHNLSYDWVFLRRFFFQKWGNPVKQLNTKPHYPIFVSFANKVTLRDSLILAQRSLEKWAKDLDVEHKKASGKWDYEKLRGQREDFSKDELEYIEHDTLAGVECIDTTMKALKKKVYSIPYTATGIPREEVRERGQAHNAHDWFLRTAPTYEQQILLEYGYHGGYTHANRHLIGETITGLNNGWMDFLITCRDFSSSYPFCILAKKFPSERFYKADNCKMGDILDQMEEYAFLFKLRIYNFRLKDDSIAMPYLQASKCIKKINCIEDNGRILCGSYAEIYLTELDLSILAEQYEIEGNICTDVWASVKDYLPRWLTDYVFELYEAKCKLKGGDPVLYALAKARLNSVYGLTVQKPVRDEIAEDYKTGEYKVEPKDPEEEYRKYINRHGSVLPYWIGVWVTAYATRNLFNLGKCIDYENGGQWVYSDTDSIYATKWNEEKLLAYNESCKDQLRANGYGPVVIGTKEYWLGIAELDAQYTEFRASGAKRYCGRSLEDGKLHITVAGVPKKGSDCLDDKIENFRTGAIFRGEVTGKKTHTYFYNEIYTDQEGNLTGDSIDLSPCDYELDSVTLTDWEKLWEEEIQIQVYDEE